MSFYKQVKVGPELLSASGESWVGYYVFAILAILLLAGGGLLIENSAMQGTDKILCYIGVMILALVSTGISIVCHLMGHLFDSMNELGAAQADSISEPRT